MLGKIVLVVVLVVGCAFLADAGVDHICFGDSRSSIDGVCGRSLSNMMRVVCHKFGGFYVPHNGKRSPEHGVAHMMPKSEAMKFLTKRGSSVGITCECCYNACGWSEMVAYCQNPPSMKRSLTSHDMRALPYMDKDDLSMDM